MAEPECHHGRNCVETVVGRQFVTFALHVRNQTDTTPRGKEHPKVLASIAVLLVATSGCKSELDKDYMPSFSFNSSSL